MLFNVEYDQGDRIAGYVVPDDYEQSAVLRICDQGQEITRLPCMESKPALVAAGRHATGLCGFLIDDGVVSDLRARAHLEIYDRDSGFLIYRRRPNESVFESCMFRLETHLFPLWLLDQAAELRFRLFHKGVERHGRETALQVLHLADSGSLYVSGRLYYKSYSYLLEDRFKMAALIHDPYFEMAERLLTFKHVENFGEELLGARDMLAYKDAIAFAKSIVLDEQRLRLSFAALPRPVIALLADPLTRQFTTQSPEEPAPRNAVASTLQILSHFTVVGARNRQEFFLEEMEHLLGLDRGVLPTLPHFKTVEALAAMLRTVPEAALLLEKDLEVYQNVQMALECGL